MPAPRARHVEGDEVPIRSCGIGHGRVVGGRHPGRIRHVQVVVRNWLGRSARRYVRHVFTNKPAAGSTGRRRRDHLPVELCSSPSVCSTIRGSCGCGNRVRRVSRETDRTAHRSLDGWHGSRCTSGFARVGDRMNRCPIHCEAMGGGRLDGVVALRPPPFAVREEWGTQQTVI